MWKREFKYDAKYVEKKQQGINDELSAEFIAT